jgi:hypothetical protein
MLIAGRRLRPQLEGRQRSWRAALASASRCMSKRAFRRLRRCVATTHWRASERRRMALDPMSLPFEEANIPNPGEYTGGLGLALPNATRAEVACSCLSMLHRSMCASSMEPHHSAAFAHHVLGMGLPPSGLSPGLGDSGVARVVPRRAWGVRPEGARRSEEEGASLALVSVPARPATGVVLDLCCESMLIFKA